MLAQAAEQRERYEARRKWQLDHNTSLKEARLEGRAEGRTDEKIGIVHFCERLLKRPETAIDQLARLTLEDLTRLVNQLQNEVERQR